MLNNEFFAKLAEKISHNLPKDAGQLKDDFLNNTKIALQEAFAKLDFVTREEFEVQKKVLARLQERVSAIEIRLHKDTLTQ